MKADSPKVVCRRSAFQVLAVCGISDAVRFIAPSIPLWPSLFVAAALLLIATQWWVANQRVSMRLEPRPVIHWEYLVIDLGPLLYWCDRHGLLGDDPRRLGWADLAHRINANS